MSQIRQHYDKSHNFDTIVYGFEIYKLNIYYNNLLCFFFQKCRKCRRFVETRTVGTYSEYGIFYGFYGFENF